MAISRSNIILKRDTSLYTATYDNIVLRNIPDGCTVSFPICA